MSRQDNHHSGKKQAVSYTLRVRYFETDQMQVAHHAHYFVWFEAARSEFCRVRGIDYTAVEAAGFFLPILEARCRYLAPARYDDEITISVRVIKHTKFTLTLGYSVTCGDRQLAEGETLQMLIDRKGKPCSFPPEIAARFDDDPSGA
ncbi:MAG TPA: thioesterase family protein [Chthonomonadaceae bacterium]|nr:thioesterase family protein [Chthonomonadaceae bacterium]